MKGIRMRRLVLPVLAGLATSAVVAAFGVAGESSTTAAGPPPAVAGQVIGQLRLDGVGTMTISSFSWGVSNPVTIGSGGGGSGSGKASFSSFSFLKSVDGSSAALFTAAATGKHIAEGVFTAQWGTGGSAVSAKYEFEPVFVESVQQSGAGGSTPTESLSLAYEKVKWTFTDSSGTTSGTWDVVNNSP